MSQLFRFPGAVKRDPSIAAWIKQQPGVLGEIAERWFEVMRACGDDVREVLHDGHPTACVADAAFAYVNAFTAHVNVGFFRGAEIADPKGLLEGTGRLMRHVKIHPWREVDSASLSRLVETAYTDMKARVRAKSLPVGQTAVRTANRPNTVPEPTGASVASPEVPQRRGSAQGRVVMAAKSTTPEPTHEAVNPRTRAGRAADSRGVAGKGGSDE